MYQFYQTDTHVYIMSTVPVTIADALRRISPARIYEVWNFNSGNYLFTTDTK